MVNKFLRKRSKRMKCRTKYKIVKKVAEHNRKLKKEKRKHPEKFRKRADPGVPNSLPFKDKVVAEAIEAKRLQDEARAKRREEATQRRKENRGALVGQKRNIGSAVQLIKEATERQAEFERRQAAENGLIDKNLLTDTSAKAYYKEFKKVVEAADVILQVLDSRDPMGSRCLQVEEFIASKPNKKLVFVLNKADLVPRPNLEKWLKYLRGFSPVVAFKASTQTQNSKLGQASGGVLQSSDKLMNSSRCIGHELLLSLLKNYSNNKGLKTTICVGIVGLPNVGKSSIINSLKRAKACGVASVPGFTKTMQEVKLDSHVKLLDCPGLVLPGGDASDASAALRNAFSLGNLDDPIKPAAAILSRCDKNQLMLHYRLQDWSDTTEFLSLLARRLGKVQKGGILDQESAAKALLHDWNVGRIKYFTEPPSDAVEQVGEAKLVTELAPEFDLDAFLAQESQELSELPVVRPSDAIPATSSGMLTEVREMQEEETMEEENGEEEEEDMEEEGENLEDDSLLPAKLQVTVGVPAATEEKKTDEKKPRWETEVPTIDLANASLKKLQKKAQKKARKESRRNVHRTDDLADALESFGGVQE